LRHGEDLILQVHGHKPYGDDDECHGRNPLVSRYGDTGEESFTTHANKLFRGNIGGDQGSANGPPGKRTFGQEKVFGVGNGFLFLLINPVTIARNNDEIKQEYGKVNRL
jgi:hypothetical protein